MRKKIIFAMLLLLGWIIIAEGALLKRGDIVSLKDSSVVNSDLYMFGREVDCGGGVLGDFITGGQYIDINGNVARNFYGAGQRIRLKGNVKEDFIAFAQDILVDGKIMGGFKGACAVFTLSDTVWGDVAVAGGQIKIDEDAVIYGNLYAGSGELTVKGLVEGNVIAYTDSFKLSGHVTKSVKVTSEVLTFAEGAKIDGNLHYRCGEESGADYKQFVAGDIVFTKYVGDEECESCGMWKFWCFGSALLTVLILTGFFRKSMDSGFALFLQKGWIMLLTGFLGMIAIPVIAVILMITILGIPVALVMLGGYFIFLYIGWITTAVILGKYLLKLVKREKVSTIAAGVIGIVLLSVIGMIPVVGCLAGFLAVLAGFGTTLGLFYDTFWGKK